MNSPAATSAPGSNGLLVALRAEVFALRHTFGPWLLIVVPAAAVSLRLALARLSPGSAAETANGYGFLVDGLSTGLVLLYLIFIAYAAYSFAVDRDHGVVRHLTIRRVSRRALLGAKLLVLHLLALLSLAAVALTSLMLTRLFWELGPVKEDGFVLIDVVTIQEEIRTGLTLALLPLPATLALGLFISVCARSATQAVTLAVGIALVVDLFKGAFGKAAYYFYGTFQPSLMDQSYLGEVARIVRGYSDVLLDPAFQQLNLWVPVPQAVGFFILALLVIGRKRL